MVIEPPYYPIVYVRGFAPTAGAREGTFNDAYYGFAETSVEKRATPPLGDGKPRYRVDVFEGQLVRLLKEYGYVDAWNNGLMRGIINPAQVDNPLRPNPTRGIWISRFYDQDYLESNLRGIEEHARDLRDLICEEIPRQLQESGVNLCDENGVLSRDYRVILIAHSMGGLVCRTLIQNLLPNDLSLAPADRDARRWVHRLATMGTPHGGIDFGNLPDFLEKMVADAANPLGGDIFQERAMRSYLKMEQRDRNGAFAYALNSLGDSKFPPGRCLCVIGSDYRDYDITRKLTGDRSDGLVKQDNAFIAGAYTANVHRAHSGYRGLVNSYESYQNIQRFLFGDAIISMWLSDMEVHTRAQSDLDHFDVEFQLSIRNTGTYIHQRRREPGENAISFTRAALEAGTTRSSRLVVPLHTTFLNSHLRQDPDDPFLHFALSLRVLEHRVRDGFLVDWEYPERVIFSETMEVRLRVSETPDGVPEIQYRWFSDATHEDDAAVQTGGATPTDWRSARPDEGGLLSFPLRGASAFGGTLYARCGVWPNASTQQ